MIKNSNIYNNLNSDVANNELIVARQLFPTCLKIDEKAKEIYKNFNVEEYISKITESSVNTNSIYGIRNNENVAANDNNSFTDVNNLSDKIDLANNRSSISDNANVCNNKCDINSYKDEFHFLRSNPLHLNKWYKFLELYEREEAYENFLLIFPRCTLYWIKYAELKIKNKKYKDAYVIYRKCIDSNTYDLKFFISFLYFAYYTASIHEYISFLFESLKCVGIDINSGCIWVELLYILIKIYNTNLLLNNNIQNLLYDPFKNISSRDRNETPLLPSDKEQIIFKSVIPNNNAKITYIEHYAKDEKLRKFFQYWLNNATKYLDRVWKCFCSFEKNNDNFTNTYLSVYNAQYSISKNAYKELYNLYKEMNLDKKYKIVIPINKKSKIENNLFYIKWIKIINFEKSNPLKLKFSLTCKRIMYAYEQALIHLQFNADLWFSYFQFLLLNKKFNYAIRIMREAIEIYLPFDELLKLNFSYFFENNSLINQAYYVYQLMLNNVSKKKKKFSLSFLYSKKRFKKLPYYHLKNKKKKKKIEKKNDDEAKNENKKEENPKEGKKRRGSNHIEKDENSNKKIQKIQKESIDDNDEKEKIGKKCNDNSLEKDDKDKMKVSSDSFQILSDISDDDIKKKFYQSDYEKVEDRKKYFIKYMNINKKKRRNFVFSHFLNFIKRNFDETIWRYYVDAILNQEKCSEEIYCYCANIERRIFNNEKRAIYIMNEGCKKFSSKKKFLFYYINFLLEKGNLNHIRTLVYKYVHDFYVKFYKEYEENYSFDNKNIKSTSGKNEFNLFDPIYLKLLKKKNKSCDQIWNLLIRIEIFYGDIRYLNKIFETKSKYDSGYNLEEYKNVLLDFTNLSNDSENVLLENDQITDILCKGYFENLKKNDIDSLQFKINLINSQLFAGTCLKKTFSFFHIKHITPFYTTILYDNIKKKRKKKEIKEKKESTIILNYQLNEEYINENDDFRKNDPNKGEIKNKFDHILIKENMSNYGNNQISSIYNSFNFHDSESFTKKKK